MSNFQFTCPESRFSISFEGMDIRQSDITPLDAKLDKAHQGMLDIEKGLIKNPDENRKVTHFTDRIDYPKSALFTEVENFAKNIRYARIVGSKGKPFTQVVINGIGGSALGPQLMQFAVNGPYWNERSAQKRKNMPKIYFVDNTDEAGIADLLPVLDLEETLVVNISKSGGTQETRNNMFAFIQAFNNAGIDFGKHAAAITMKGSQLDRFAHENGFIAVFEMADSIGGRTSETSIVGHLPAALAGIDFAAFLEGACTMDRWTRLRKTVENPAYFLALSWYLSGNAKGDRNMVIVPYSDRLVLFARYLQQLVMESLGKEKDLDGQIVHQGLSVFGNKGGTDAHAFIQQLNDGRNDFFATFIEPLKDPLNIPIEGNVQMGDYLHGFERGLVSALRSKGRKVIEIRIPEVTPFYLGMLIALYERAVAFYAELIHINAFHQPGVESYKKAAKAVIALHDKLQTLLKGLEFEGNAAALASKLGLAETEIAETEIAETEGLLAKYAANPERRFPGFKVSRAGYNNGWVYKIQGA